MDKTERIHLPPDENLACPAVAILKKGEGRTLKAGGLWIYDNEIDSIMGSFENGDILSVQDFDGFFMGYGFINTASKIRIRMLSRRKENRITPAFLEKRIKGLLGISEKCNGHRELPSYFWRGGLFAGACSG